MSATEMFKVGAKFRSFEDFNKCLRKYEKEVQQIYSKKNSKTIKACKLKGPYNEELQFYELHYVCKRGGNFKSKGAGIRNYRSNKTNCEAEIKLRAQHKKYLTIVKLEAEHNHPPILDMEELDDGQSKNYRNMKKETSDSDDCDNSNVNIDEVRWKEPSSIRTTSESENCNNFDNNENGVVLENQENINRKEETVLVTYDPIQDPIQDQEQNQNFGSNQLLHKQLHLLLQQLQQVHTYQQHQDERLKQQEKQMQQQRKKLKQQEIQLEQQGQKLQQQEQQLQQQEQQLHQQEQLLQQLRQQLQPQ